MSDRSEDRPDRAGPDRYPPYVESTQGRARWDLCVRIAEELVGDPDADPAEVDDAVALQLRSAG